MGFSSSIRDEIFVKSARHCCVCHRYRGLKVEIHHILPKKEGGKDTYENAISLCFDCHADAGHYFAGHPKGSRLSPEELLKHKTEWFKLVAEHKIEASKEVSVELNVKTGNFSPIFIRETTSSLDRNIYKRTAELLGKDPMDFFRDLQNENKMGPFYVPHLNNLKTYDEHIDFLNGDIPKKDFLRKEDENENTDCQPILHHFPSFISSSSRELNLSNCTIKLKFTNTGIEVIEDYKLYLYFDNVIKVDSVNKNSSITDMFEYRYNILFNEAKIAEFIPKSNILVQNDSVDLDEICFRTHHTTKKVRIKWELFARDFHDVGYLELQIVPKFEIENKSKYVENPEEFKQIVRVLPKLKFE